MDKKLSTKKNDLIYRLNLILKKYHALDLTKSDIYLQLKTIVDDGKWISKLSFTLSKIKNSEKIFDISKEINQNKNDQRVLEMFAEFDTADKLVNTKFFGTFDAMEYLAQNPQRRQPDFLASTGSVITPIEVKLLSPQDSDEKKFFQKFLDKINNHAIEQLKGFYETKKFESGMIYVWTHRQIPLYKLDYDELNKYVQEKVPKQNFKITILCMLYGKGLWDFYI